MSDMCKTCGAWMMFPESHRCPPKFDVIDADGGYGDDPWQWAKSIRAHDPCDAAEKYADDSDCEGDYSIVRGSPATIFVRDASGEITCWTVTGESVPSYSAYPTERSPSIESEIERLGGGA